MAERGNGGIIGPVNQPTATVASGVWTLEEQTAAQRQSRWPSSSYEIQRSLRFNSADSAYLLRQPSSAGNRQIFTLSCWVKRSALGAYSSLLTVGGSDVMWFTPSDTIEIASAGGSLLTSAVYRDVSAWYHVVIAFDTPQATASNRIKLYVNGVQVTAFSTATYPAQNANSGFNNTSNHLIGAFPGTLYHFNGYMTEINFIDGQALTPSSFGAFDAQTGVWGPTPYAGTYGTNGFYLNFSDNSNTTAATLGKDYSGNGNNWTPNNFSVSAGAGNDSLVDVPTNWGTDTGVGGSVRGNYCTLNPLGTAGAIPTNGNLAVSSSSTVGNRISTILLTTGKWYWEGSGNGYVGAVIGVDGGAFTDSISVSGSKSIGYWWDGGLAYWDGGNSGTGTSYNSTDIIGVALDMDIGNVKFYKNNTLIHNLSFGSGTVPNLSSGVYAGYNIGGGDSSVNLNFGQRPFAYTAPSGFKALNTQNLPTPTIGATTATQAGKFFNPVLYTGNGFPISGTQSVSGVGFQPDWVWIKSRSAAGSNTVTDVVRGINSQLLTNTTGVEQTNTDNITALNSDGFSLGSNTTGSTSVNVNGQTYVAWNWKANGTGVTNTAGSITSTVSANTTSGFSVVTFAAAASSTVGHGLGVAPSMVVVKSRTVAGNFWLTYHVRTGPTGFLAWNTTDAFATNSTVWNNTAPTSSVFTIGSGFTNASYGNCVAYCFAEVPGYSRFGSYTGNGSADGPFVFCGFRPAYVMIKASSDGPFPWLVFDRTRNPSNVVTQLLLPNASDAEYTVSALDFTANGFKLRDTNTSRNNIGTTYIFMAFAEAPQKFALAR